MVMAVGVTEPVIVSDGPGRVGTGPVGVYDGSNVASPPPAMLVGGQPIPAVAEAGIVSAPGPPVCHDCNC